VESEIAKGKICLVPQFDTVKTLSILSLYNNKELNVE